MTKAKANQTINAITDKGEALNRPLTTAFTGPVSEFEVKLYSPRVAFGKTVLKGRMTETLMYSHVNAIEWTLSAVGGTAEIEIEQDGESRWIQYADGVRVDLFERETK